MAPRILKDIEGAHDGEIWSVSWRTGSHIVTGGNDDTVKVWHAGGNDITCAHVLTGHELGVVSVSSSTMKNNNSGGGKSILVASSSMDSQLRLHKITGGEGDEKGSEASFECLGNFPVDQLECWSASLSNDGALITTGTADGRVLAFSTTPPGFDPVGGESSRGAETGSKFIVSTCFSPDSSTIAAGSGNGSIHLIDVATMKKSPARLASHTKRVRCVEYANQGGDSNNSGDNNNSSNSPSYSSSSLLVSGADDGRAIVHDPREAMSSSSSGGSAGQSSGSAVATLGGHKGWVTDISVSGDLVATASSQGIVRVWDMRMREVVHSLADHKDQAWGVAFAPGGDRLVTVGDDGHLFVYENVRS